MGPVGLLVVAGKMLGAGAAALYGLNAPDHSRRHFAGEQRILGEILKIPSAQRISVDVEARSQQDVGALLLHFQAEEMAQGFHGLRVPGAGQRRTTGQQRSIIARPDSGGTVGGGNGGNALIPQGLGGAAQHTRVALYTEGTVHLPLAPGNGIQLFRGQLGHKRIHMGFSGTYIPKQNALVPGIGNLPGHFCQNVLFSVGRRPGDRLVFRGEAFPLCLWPQALKIRRRRSLGAELPHKAELFQLPAQGRRRAAHIRTHIEGVFSGFQHIGIGISGNAGIIKGGKVFRPDPEGKGLGFSGRQDAGFPEGRQIPQGLSQLSLGRLSVDLDHFPAGTGSGIAHRHIQNQAVLFQSSPGFQAEGGVAQSEAEGVEHLFRREGLIVAVTHIDVFGIGVLVPSAEIAIGGCVLIAQGDGIGQPSAGLRVAVEHIDYPVAGLHAALEGVQHRLKVILPCPAQVYDVARVNDHHGFLEFPGHLLQQSPLLIRQVVAALFGGIVHALPHGSAQNHHSGFAFFRSPADLLVAQRHFRVAGGPLGPVTDLGNVAGTPVGVETRQLPVVDNVSPVPEGIHGAHQVVGVHVAAGAVAHIEIVVLDPAEKSGGGPLVQGQHPLIFQQHQPVAGGFSAGPGHHRVPLRFSQHRFVQGLCQFVLENQLFIFRIHCLSPYDGFPHRLGSGFLRLSIVIFLRIW